MCNVSGNLHGGCGAWLVDHCSSLALLALSGGDEERWTTSGVSTNLNLNYLKAAPVSPDQILSFRSIPVTAKQADSFLQPLVGNKFENCYRSLELWKSHKSTRDEDLQCVSFLSLP